MIGAFFFTILKIHQIVSIFSNFFPCFFHYLPCFPKSFLPSNIKFILTFPSLFNIISHIIISYIKFAVTTEMSHSNFRVDNFRILTAELLG